MSKDFIKIKGVSGGFQLMVDSSADFSQIKEAFERKLAQHPEFFPPETSFQLATPDLPKEVRTGLESYLQGKGLKLTDVIKRKKASVSEADSKRNDGEDAQQVMKVINRTVRNGEEIISHGSLMVCGNVNPGAKLVAAGSIDVRGNCRGIVHAGAMGDYQAFVVADRLMPMQIRIANLIARSPDEPEISEYPEKAYIKDGQILIEPIER